MKRFKYLYFTNIINKPYFNFWFLKKLKDNKEDDNNLLTQAGDFSNGGIDWTWQGMNITGQGKATGGSSFITDENIPLKEDLEKGSTYSFSIADPITNNLRIYLQKPDGSTAANYIIQAGTTSRTFTLTADSYKKTYRLMMNVKKDTDINITIKDIKLEKVVS